MAVPVVPPTTPRARAVTMLARAFGAPDADRRPDADAVRSALAEALAATYGGACATLPRGLSVWLPFTDAVAALRTKLATVCGQAAVWAYRRGEAQDLKDAIIELTDNLFNNLEQLADAYGLR